MKGFAGFFQEIIMRLVSRYLLDRSLKKYVFLPLKVSRHYLLTRSTIENRFHSPLFYLGNNDLTLFPSCISNRAYPLAYPALLHSNCIRVILSSIKPSCCFLPILRVVKQLQTAFCKSVTLTTDVR